MSASLTATANPFVISMLVKNAVKAVFLPLIGLAVFLLLWEFGSSKVQTSLGQFPGPGIVLNQVKGLYQEYQEDKASAAAFYERQEKRFAEARAQDPNFVAEHRDYKGKPTFIQQIFTSLKTVFTGFILASLVAIPLGIAIGLSANLYAAINPLIQLFKPISPLAWLPLVTILVSAVYTNPDGIPKSFITSAMTVMLCSLWPTLINTAVGVTSVSSDLINVSRVLRLNWLRHVIYRPAFIFRDCLDGINCRRNARTKPRLG
jgi:nitrate/nitrite transport system permease protein